MLKMIRETVERLLETSPTVPDHIIHQYNNRYKAIKSGMNEKVAHPEITEGVIEVKVNRNTYDDEVDPKLFTAAVPEKQEKPKLNVRLVL
jgi:hypothetical protein